MKNDLLPWPLAWLLEHHPKHREVAGSIPVRAVSYLGSVPGQGTYRRQPMDVSLFSLTLMSLSLSPSPPTPSSLHPFLYL